MNINKLIAEKGVTKYKVAKQSGISQTTMIDICSGKVRLEKCSAETVYKLAKALDVSMEALVTDACEYRPAFETFKSNICHSVKEKGDIDFLIDTIKSDSIMKLYEKQWYPECLYLLAMVDYLSRENDIPLCSDYEELRRAKLHSVVYPSSIIAMDTVLGSDEWKERSRRDSIPEFIRHNIVEAEVRNVV